MNEQTDGQLLEAYAGQRLESAFAELVQRHLDFVYSVALRTVRDAHLAEDVTQGVFVALAKDASQLKDRANLFGWLHQTARNIAAQTVRTTERRRARELEAVTMNQLLTSEPDPEWEQMAPHLDAILEELDESDRDALLLRYFKNYDLRMVGAALGVSGDAAQKRVSRALEKLQGRLSQRGIVSTAAAAGAVISINAVQAAPSRLGAVVTSAAISGTTAATTAVAVTKVFAMTVLQKALVTTALAVCAGAGIYEAHQVAQLNDQNRALQQQYADQSQQMQRERDEASNQLAGLMADNARLKANLDEAELLKLRAEVARLRSKESDPTQGAEDAIAAKVKLLKQRLEQMPEKRVPEMVMLSDSDWTIAVWDEDLNTDDGVREALSKLRERAEAVFLSNLKRAIFKYKAMNNGALPPQLSQIKSYDASLTDEMLQRYQLFKPQTPRDDLVKLVAPYADPDYDSDHMISLDGGSKRTFNKAKDAVRDAVLRFTGRNDGRLPDSPTQLTPYLDRTVETAAIQKYLNQFRLEHGDSPLSFEATAVLMRLAKAYSIDHPDKSPSETSDLLPYIKTEEERNVFEQMQRVENISK